MEHPVKNLLDLLSPHLNTAIMAFGAGIAAFVVKKFLGPKLLAKFAKTKDRAALLEEAAEFAVKHLKGLVESTPNKYDDLGLELLKAIESWAEAKRVELSLVERTDVALAAREKLVKDVAFAAALSPAKIAGVDLSGMKVK
jgi:hypothetical protein